MEVDSKDSSWDIIYASIKVLGNVSLDPICVVWKGSNVVYILLLPAINIEKWHGTGMS